MSYTRIRKLAQKLFVNVVIERLIKHQFKGEPILA